MKNIATEQMLKKRPPPSPWKIDNSTENQKSRCSFCLRNSKYMFFASLFTLKKVPLSALGKTVEKKRKSKEGVSGKKENISSFRVPGSFLGYLD